MFYLDPFSSVPNSPDGIPCALWNSWPMNSKISYVKISYLPILWAFPSSFYSNGSLALHWGLFFMQPSHISGSIRLGIRKFVVWVLTVISQHFSFPPTKNPSFKTCQVTVSLLSFMVLSCIKTKSLSLTYQ